MALQYSDQYNKPMTAKEMAIYGVGGIGALGFGSVYGPIPFIYGISAYENSRYGAMLDNGRPIKVKKGAKGGTYVSPYPPKYFTPSSQAVANLEAKGINPIDQPLALSREWSRVRTAEALAGRVANTGFMAYLSRTPGGHLASSAAFKFLAQSSTFGLSDVAYGIGAAGKQLVKGNFSRAASLRAIGGVAGSASIGAVGVGLVGHALYTESGLVNRSIGTPMGLLAFNEWKMQTGAGVGFMLGSAAGSAIAPGAGTLIGGIVGGIAGVGLASADLALGAYNSWMGRERYTMREIGQLAGMASQGYLTRNPFRPGAQPSTNQGAMTLRQMSLAAIHKSPLNDRARLLGREATRMMTGL